MAGSPKHRLTSPHSGWAKVLNKSQGRATVYVSVSGNRDSDGDVVVPGASAYGLQFLAEQGLKPKGVWSHDWSTPVAKTLDATELYPGDRTLPGALLTKGLGALKIDGQWNLDTQAGADAFSNLDFYGEEQQYSVGYDIHQAFPGGAGVVPTGLLTLGLGDDMLRACKALGEDDLACRFIAKWVTYEFSEVLFGANALAGTQAGSVKALESMDEVLHDFQRARERIVVLLDQIEDKARAHGVEPPEPTENETKGLTMFDQRVQDTEEAIAHLSASFGEKAGRVQARRNEQRLRAMRDTIGSMLAEIGAEDDGEGSESKALRLPDGAVEVKVWASMAGSWEQRRDAVLEAVDGAFPEAPDGESQWISVESMFDDMALVSVDDCDGDPPDYFLFPYTIDGEGTAVLGAAAPVDLVLTLIPDDDYGDDPDDPKPSTGIVAAPGTPTLSEGTAGVGYATLEPGKSVEADVKAHEFKPDSEHPRRCAECGAGRVRPWHTDPPEDEAKAKITAADLMEFKSLAGVE